MPEYYTGTDNTPQVRNYKTPTGYYSGAVSGIPLTSAALTPTQPFQIPQQKPDTTPYNQMVAGGNAFIKGSILPEEPQQDMSLASLMKGLTEQPSSADLYNQAYNTSGIDFAQQEALNKKLAVKAAQRRLGGIQSELQAVADSAKQQNLQLEKDINVGSTGVGGAGALASGSFLNVRQQEINRQAAISSLPLQARALAAAAEVAGLQGEAEYANSTLALAQEKLDTVFKLMSEDSSRKQDLQMKMFDVIYNDLNKKEQARVDEMKSQITTNQSSLSDARNFAQTLSATALANRQADIAAQLTQIPQPDVRSKTFTQDLKNYNNEIARLQGQIKAKASPGGGTTTTQPPIIDTSGNVLEYGTPDYVIARLKQTSGSKTKPVASEREQLGKFANVVALTDNLMGSLSKTTNDPILGYLRSLNPYDFDARAVNAQVIALVPSVARALYGEVGVLTDTDIERYLKTLPNIKSTADQNKFIATMTLANAKRSYEQTLLNLANSNVNVSGFSDSYKALTDKLTKLEKTLGADALADIPSENIDVFDSVASQPQEGGYFSKLWSALIGK